jgi:3-dehydroquinate dehydratase-2
MKLLILNGPNLNMLGIREPDIYGNRSFSALEDFIRETCREEDIDCTLFQSNYEGALVEKIQEAYDHYDGIVINPAAYTHTSVAILDALKAVGIPTVEVHLSKVDEREPFRQISYVSYVAIKTVTGLGFEGYAVAIRYLKEYLHST